MIHYLLFDLDNTVYSIKSGLEDTIVQRIYAYGRKITGLDEAAFDRLRRNRMPYYGTSLEWFMSEYGFTDSESFFSFIHPEGEEACLVPDPALGALLDSIKLPKAVFTNSPCEHAERVLNRLGIADRFEAVYDIRFNGLRGKPHREAVERVCSACGVPVAEAALIDDAEKHVRGMCEAGGLGILRDELGRHPATHFEHIRNLDELPALISRYNK